MLHLPTFCEQAERELQNWDNNTADQVIEVLRWTDLADHNFKYSSEVGNFSVMQIKRITKMLIHYECPGIIEYMWSTQLDSLKAQKNIQTAHEEYEKTRLLWSMKVFFKQYWNFLTNIEQFKSTWYSNPVLKESISAVIVSMHDYLQKMTLSNDEDIIMRHNFKNVSSYLELNWLNDPNILSSLLDISQYAYYFLESYYISNIEDRERKDAFILLTKTYSLIKAINIASKDLLDWHSEVNLNINIENDSVEWISWDMVILINNMIDNAITRWEADKIEIYQVFKNRELHLFIADNWKGIDLEKFPNPNMIFTSGLSGAGSTGIGLSELKKRWIECSVSNEGLDSVYRDTDKTANDKWALFKIKLDIVNPTV